MAKGRQNKESGYCDYQFEDGTYCKETIELTILQESGKSVTRSGWDDKEKRNYCLFHSHNDDKGEFFYPEIKNRIDNANVAVKKKLAELDKKQLSKLERKKQEGKIRNEHFIDFEGFYFPKKADFKRTVFDATVGFLNAEFGGEVDFGWATFSRQTFFINSKFHGEADFNRTEFGGEAYFESAKFRGEASFELAKFGEVANFNGATFGGEADFTSARFSRRASFSGAQLDGRAGFFEAGFGRKADFRYARFGGEAYFADANFNGEADFTCTTFSGMVDFNNTKFSREASFREATFVGSASFFETKFSTEAIFWSAKFGEEVYFSSANFSGRVVFLDARFSGGAYFERSLFYKGANCTYSDFLKYLNFTDAAFLSGELVFWGARFPEEETFFNKTIFNCEVLFHEQMLKGVRFTGCYLGSASFYGSDVRDAVFINSSWNRRFLEKQVQRLIKQERIGKDTPVLEISRIIAGGSRRAVLFDEKIYKSSKNPGVLEKIWKKISSGFFSFYRGIKNHLKKPDKKKRKLPLSNSGVEPSRLELDPLYLEHLYCQFKLAMDRNKMYGLANDFYHGEKMMEMKRLKEEHSYLKWFFLWLYRLLAGFGNKPWRAIFSLILILFASSFLLIKFNGLTVTDSKEAFKRCPCKTEENIKAVTAKPDSIQAAALAKVERSFISRDMAGLVVSLNNLKKFHKESKPGEIPGTGPPKDQAEYSLKCNYLCNVFHISLWNLTATPGRRSGDYKENGWGAYLAVFCIQYIFRPLMVALIIISVRRRVYRG